MFLDIRKDITLPLNYKTLSRDKTFRIAAQICLFYALNQASRFFSPVANQPLHFA